MNAIPRVARSRDSLREHSRRRLAIALVAASLAGCESGGGSPLSPTSDLARLWPNDDGNSWVFEVIAAQDSADVRALDGLVIDMPREADPRDLESRLWLPFPNEPDESPGAVRLLRLGFDGSVRTAAGFKQLLRGEFLEEGELRPQLAKSAEALVGMSFLLGDRAFEKRMDWIGFYPRAESEDSSYTVVRTPLVEGAAFRHQLAVPFSETSWEYGWVLGERAIATPAGLFDNAIGLAYIIDFGVQRVFGEVNGLFRIYSLSVFYLAPGVGPVCLREIRVFDPIDPAGEPDASFQEMKLREYALAED